MDRNLAAVPKVSLPVPALPTGTVSIGDVEVEVRGLTRAEAFHLQQSFEGDPDAGDAFIIACGTGVTPEEAQEWRTQVTFDAANAVMLKVMELSGIADEGDGKDPQGRTSKRS